MIGPRRLKYCIFGCLWMLLAMWEAPLVTWIWDIDWPHIFKDGWHWWHAPLMGTLLLLAILCLIMANVCFEHSGTKSGPLTGGDRSEK